MSNYSELLEKRGWTVLHEEVFGSWQGDYAITLKRNDIYAFTIIGYGSCSGCDTYEALIPYEEYDYEVGLNGDGRYTIKNQKEIDEAGAVLAKDLEESIAVMGDKLLVVQYIASEERLANDWYRHEDGWQVAVDRLIKSVHHG